MGHEAALKATNRQIRRAFGPHAAESIASRDDRLVALTKQVNELTTQVATMSQRLTELNREHDHLEDRFDDAQRQLDYRIAKYFAGLSWYRKLRLVVFGR